MTNPLIESVDEMLDKARDGDKRESIDNRARGCGHLHPNACYLRSDLAALGAEDGEIPAFIEFDEPVEYREHTGRGAIIPGYKPFPGNTFVKHYTADGRSTTPSGDISDHFDRLDRHGFNGDHYGNITSARAHDVLMSVGASNWADPDDFVTECRNRGLNLRIPASNNNPPPIVEPLRTRVFVIHPNGCGDNRAGIIGYAYITRNIYTSGTKANGEDADIPAWAEDYATTRRDFNVVDRGEPIAEDDPGFDDAQMSIAEAVDGIDDPDIVAPSDKDGRDVEAVVSTPVEDADYNALKSTASDTEGVDVGQSPTRDELLDTLRDAGVTHIN